MSFISDVGNHYESKQASMNHELTIYDCKYYFSLELIRLLCHSICWLPTIHWLQVHYLSSSASSNS